MKKLIVCVLILSLLLCGCAEKQNYDPARLEYPGLSWGASPEEALHALGKTEEEIIEKSDVHRDDMWDSVICLSGVEAFGQETSLVVLLFRDITETGETYELIELRLYYPDGSDGAEAADVAALEAELERVYGLAGQVQHWDGETRSCMDVTADRPANVFAWDSALTSWDCMTEQQREGLQRYYSVWRGRTLDMEETAKECQDAAFRIRLQPYFNEYMARMGHEMPEESRSLGMTNLCIHMDALYYSTTRMYAEVGMELE